MADAKIQLGSLEFEDIKQSIIDFMTTQRTGSAAELKDYDFEGSALQTLIEVLAYNTLYYGHYSNMIANEMFLDTAQKVESLISLVKPLGYVVPGFNSASAQIRIISGGSYRNIPKYSSFIGQNTNGASYVFYTLEESNLDDQGKGIIQIHEGKTLVSTEVTLNNNNKTFLTGTDIDISTLTVEVKDNTGVWKEWSLSSNIQYNLDENSEVYWLERSEFGFFIVFGGFNVMGGAGSTIGKVPPVSNSGTPNIRVKYLISSGEKGNGVTSFKYNNLYNSDEDLSDNHQIVGLTTSSEGSDEPDIEAIRFFAPKWFAAQGRAVTKSDCKAILAANGFASDTTTIWGGEEMNPPMYGRLFVSLITEDGDDEEATQAISILEEKTCVTILPEYVSAVYHDVDLRVNVLYDAGGTEKSIDQMRNQASSLISDLYGTTKFNNNFDIQPIISALIALDPAYRVSEDSFDFSLNLTRSAGDTSKIIKFFNSIDSDLENGEAFSTTAIENNTLLEDGEIYLEDVDGIIRAYRIQNGVKTVLGDVGTINYSSGVVKIKNIANSEYTIKVKPKNTLKLDAPENMVLRVTPTVTVTAV